MAKSGPIIIVEDDKDDQHFYLDIFQSLAVPNPIRFFENCTSALQHLMQPGEHPFLILCDVNLPGMDGIEFRRQVIELDYIRNKSIPFVYFATAAEQEVVAEAYKMMVQGYFEKPNNITEFKMLLRLIIDYWTHCKHPDTQ